jgi:hypothetical protein
MMSPEALCYGNDEADSILNDVFGRHIRIAGEQIPRDWVLKNVEHGHQSHCYTFLGARRLARQASQEKIHRLSYGWFVRRVLGIYHRCAQAGRGHF